MEKQTVFVKKYPSKGELPSKRGTYISNIGDVKWCKKHGFYYETILATVKTCNVKWFLQEIELPSNDEITKAYLDYKGVINNPVEWAGNFILNKLGISKDNSE